MSLKFVDVISELYSTWDTLILILVLAITVNLMISFILQLNISIIQNIVTTVILGLIFAGVWNTIHPSMHNHKVDILLQDGIPGMHVEISKDNLYFKNHMYHHHIKGDKKGNYNVVYLGFDEFMGSNKLVKY
jgi:hypothetical protein